jgi:hypothetical protein
MRLWFPTFLLYYQLQNTVDSFTLFPKFQYDKAQIRFSPQQKPHLLHVECNSDTMGECELPDTMTRDEDYSPMSVLPQRALVLRKSQVTDRNGNRIILGDVMGPGKSVVVFLRHLG